ncbi:RluA family pseudouridine synthase [uncultured Paraglaciecola sp.]|jgi:tRNA pseudouridine32 synthase / 23S rRNA pseudouridine746 synthase|uniref:RluA family pseudouridine synthase n=1 Tax=uncultured Paraglaciecola sp. TaxID=1765024 RepID=UPI0025E8B541|nr:RluA family pseudouridine synthase [uncultured Paraglaciecola sp.]
MQFEDPCFTYFSASIEKYQLPERFTFPFYYQPHPLCILAAKQLQNHLTTQNQWQHNFGLSDDPNNIIGKMFGVLLVKNAQGELGFISAFSGKLAEQNHIQGFVPPVFDLLADDSFFLSDQVAINHLNEEIKNLENTPELVILKQGLAALEAEHAQQLSTLRLELVENRKTRKKQRKDLLNELDKTITDKGLKELAQQSVFDKWRLKELTEHSQQLIGQLQVKVNEFTDQIAALKLQRKTLSANLQNKIFNQYQFLNQAQEPKSLLDIFADTALKTPPAGAGECAAPKLLQYAFAHQLTPLAMAEFWWGASPKSEVKKHQQYYPACMGKCQPILNHMLAGMQLDDNPLIFNYGQGKNVDIIYQDQDILIVNKPTEFLSVPGKELSDSVYQRIKQQYPEATGPLIVHRLDMSTSGLMVITLNSQANKYLQKQFVQREVHKQYVALIEGLPLQDKGEIQLPVRGDYYDRPKQMVCHQDGKPAHTYWQVLERYPEKNQTRVMLTPHTGRTHQLRVHCAHADGLNMPIVGDDLYGTRGKRLHLHAQSLEITHPVSQEVMTFKVDAEF